MEMSCRELRGLTCIVSVVVRGSSADLCVSREKKDRVHNAGLKCWKCIFVKLLFGEGNEDQLSGGQWPFHTQESSYVFVFPLLLSGTAYSRWRWDPWY
jgi:hypothetical protein